MRVLIMCSAGQGHGLGHLMRGLALAEAARDMGHRVALIGDFETELALEALRESGVPVLAPDQHRSVRQEDWDVVHVDDYSVSLERYGLHHPGHGSAEDGPIISSMCDGQFGVRPCDVLIDPTPGAQDRSPEGVWRLFLRGGQYAPIRAAVQRAGMEARGIGASPSGRVAVLVVMGGADSTDAVPDALAALRATYIPLDVRVVAPRQGQSGDEPFGAGGTLRRVEPSLDIVKDMAWADLVLSAAGTSLWELCVLGMSIATVWVVDNQRQGYDEILKARAAVGLGSRLDLSNAETTAARLVPVLENAALRQTLGERARELVDGRGARRIVTAWEAMSALHH